MKIVSVTYFLDGHRTVGVMCSECPFTHQMPWLVGADVVSGFLKCGITAEIAIPVWTRNPRRDRRQHRFDPARGYQISAGQGRDDNAVDVPVPNWTE